MKITADRAALASALTWTAGAVPRKPQVSAMAGIRLTTLADAVTMQAFDGTTSHTARVPVEVAEPGEILVSGRFLAMVVDGMRGQQVTLENEGDAFVSITSGRSKYRARRLMLEDYPRLPETAECVGFIEQGDLARALRVTTGPVDDESDRPHTAGLHIEADPDSNVLWCVGADESARSLHTCTPGWENKRGIDVTVQSSAIGAAVRGMSGRLEIGAEGGIVSLRDESRAVTLRTYETTFMGNRWRDLLAAKATETVIADRAELVGALNRAGSLGSEVVGVFVSEGEIAVKAGADIGDGEDVIEAETYTDAWFGMAPSLLTQALNACESDRVQLGLQTAGEVKKVIDVRPVSDEAVRCLVMPREWKGATA